MSDAPLAPFHSTVAVSFFHLWVSYGKQNIYLSHFLLQQVLVGRLGLSGNTSLSDGWCYVEISLLSLLKKVVCIASSHKTLPARAERETSILQGLGHQFSWCPWANQHSASPGWCSKGCNGFHLLERSQFYPSAIWDHWGTLVLAVPFL